MVPLPSLAALAAREGREDPSSRVGFSWGIVLAAKPCRSGIPSSSQALASFTASWGNCGSYIHVVPSARLGLPGVVVVVTAAATPWTYVLHSRLHRVGDEIEAAVSAFAVRARVRCREDGVEIPDPAWLACLGGGGWRI